MTKINRSEQVTITYRNDRITLTGKAIKGTLSISSSELAKVYWGNQGRGTFRLNYDDEPKQS
jgi:hypothetical protein